MEKRERLYRAAIAVLVIIIFAVFISGNRLWMHLDGAENFLAVAIKGNQLDVFLDHYLANPDKDSLMDVQKALSSFNDSYVAMAYLKYKQIGSGGIQKIREQYGKIRGPVQWMVDKAVNENLVDHPDTLLVINQFRDVYLRFEQQIHYETMVIGGVTNHQRFVYDYLEFTDEIEAIFGDGTK